MIATFHYTMNEFTQAVLGGRWEGMVYVLGPPRWAALALLQLKGIDTTIAMKTAGRKKLMTRAGIEPAQVLRG